MLTPQEKNNRTSKVLALGKALAPDRFPQPSREVAAAWAKALDRLYDSFAIEDMWLEAVTVWATELVGEKMITPRELKHAVYVVRDRWEADPVKREVLEADREARQLERDRQIEAGTFGQLRGYKPRQVPANNPLRAITRDIGRQVD